MAVFCTSSGPVCPVSEGHSGGNQLVVAGLHGGGHTAQLWDHMDAGHPWASDHGTNLTLCSLYCRLCFTRHSIMDLRFPGNELVPCCSFCFVFSGFFTLSLLTVSV